MRIDISTNPSILWLHLTNPSTMKHTPGILNLPVRQQIAIKTPALPLHAEYSLALCQRIRLE